jgi:hypothetical protein
VGLDGEAIVWLEHGSGEQYLKRGLYPPAAAGLGIRAGHRDA